MPITSENDNILKVNVASGVVIKKDNKFLLVQEKKPSVYGKWNWPAGKVEIGYSFKDNAIKEAKEETGFDVEIIKRIGVYHEDGDKSVKHAFEAKIIGGKLSFPEDEILDVKWFSYDEIVGMKDKIRSSWVCEAIEDLKKNV